MRNSNRIIVVLVALLALFTPACTGDSPTQARTSLKHLQLPRNALAGWVGEHSITVYSPIGNITLDVTAGTITYASGTVVEGLSPDRVAVLATAFQILVDDAPSQVDEAMANSSACDWHTEQCDYETLRAPWRRAAEPLPNELTPVPPGGFGRIGIPSHRPRAGQGKRIGPLSLNSACQGKALEIYALQAVWRQARDDFFYFSSLLRSAANLAKAHPTDEIRQALRDAVNDIITEAQDKLRTTTGALSKRASEYGGLGCWTPNSANWRSSGPSWKPAASGATLPGPSLGGSTTRYGWVCFSRLVEDPVTHDITPSEVCEYMFAA